MNRTCFQPVVRKKIPPQVSKEFLKCSFLINAGVFGFPPKTYATALLKKLIEKIHDTDRKKSSSLKSCLKKLKS